MSKISYQLSIIYSTRPLLHSTLWLWRLVLMIHVFNEGAYLTWHLSQSSIRPSIYFNLWNHAQIHSWNQTVLSNMGKVSCSRKQQGPLMGLEPPTSILRVTPPTCCAPNTMYVGFLYFEQKFTFNKLRLRLRQCPR